MSVCYLKLKKVVSPSVSAKQHCTTWDNTTHVKILHHKVALIYQTSAHQNNRCTLNLDVSIRYVSHQV